MSDTRPARLADDARELLRAWQPVSAADVAVRTEDLDYLDRHPDALSRQGPPDHFTVGSYVFDANLEQIALVHHTKAQLWLQPGGHIEPEDATILHAALRETHEELGLDDVQMIPGISGLAGVHHHQLSARFGRCRAHRDLRFAFLVDPATQLTVSTESLDVRWWPLSALPEATDPELSAAVTALAVAAGS